MITLTNDTIDKDDIKKLIEWLNQTPIPRLTKGELTKKYEQKFADYIGTKYGVMVNSGSSAILLLLYALQWGGFLRSKEIAVPALSWVTDVSSPIQLNFDVSLVDTNLNDLSIDLTHLENTFKNKNISVFLLVSILGFVPEYDKILALCEKYDVILLEDTCESLGSEFRGIKLGNLGLASCFSTYFSHHISTIEGGMICTSNERLYDLLIMLRSHGWSRDLSEEKQKKLQVENNVNDFENFYTFYAPGFNLRSTDLQAFIGIEQLKKLPEFVLKRHTNFLLYRKYIKNNLLNLTDKKENLNSNFAYPVAVDNRTEIINNLNKNKVEVRPLVAGSMGLQPFWNQSAEELKNANFLHKHGFYLPNHHGITEDDIKFIAKIINE